MSNQANIHFINREKMVSAKVSDVFSTDDHVETSLPIEGQDETPLLEFLRASLKQIRDEGNEDRIWDVEDELLELVQDGCDPEIIDWITTFEAGRALSEDLAFIQNFLDHPVKARLREPSVKEGEFPASITEDSPFRVFDMGGWQFFDQGEFNAIIEGLHKARAATAEPAPGARQLDEEFEEEWNEILAAWENGEYDLVLIWWLV